MDIIHCPPLHRRRPVGVTEHGVEGTSKVVEARTAGVSVRHWHQAGQAYQQQQQEDLERERHPEDTSQEGPSASRCGRRRVRLRTGGSEPSVAARPSNMAPSPKKIV